LDYRECAELAVVAVEKCYFDDVYYENTAADMIDTATELNHE
jgi:hypothetical protein